MSDCRKCERFEKCGVEEDCGRFIEMQPTNYILLICKTPEELAKIFADGCPDGGNVNCAKHYSHGGRDCFNCWLDWLKSPVKADKEDTNA